MSGPSDLTRREVYPRALIDGGGARAGANGRLRRRAERLLTSRGEREEAEVERAIRSQPGVTRANTVALISPKGGVGKTTSTFIVANLLASHLKLRVVAIDANPDFGTLARLAPDELRSERSLTDLLDHLERLPTVADLHPYLTRMPSGMHLLSAPADAELASNLGPEHYGELVAYLSIFYEVVLLDLGTGVAGPLARFAIERADQVVLVTTPEWITSVVVLDALRHLRHERITVLVNKSHLRGASSLRAIEERFREERLHRMVTVPYDERLQTMLDSGTYSLDSLVRQTRLPLKRLGLSVAEQLV